MGLNAEQKAAVEYLDGPLLVLAGPGTGKTQLLSAKVAYILDNTDTNPENILCLTFTESGARNMRERLGTMVGRAASSVNIYTYHAFGANILERYKNYAENFDRDLDSVVDGITQHKIIRNIIAELPATNIIKNSKVSDLVETIQNAKSARLSADDLRQIAERNISDSNKISKAATKWLSDLVPRMKFDSAVNQVYKPLLLDLASLANQDPIVGNIEPSANLLVRDLQRIISEQLDEEKPSVSPLTKWKDKNFEKTADDTYRLKDYIANKKLLALSDVITKYDAALRASGLFDFADMIEEAIRALREDRGFRLSLSEIFQYILLDEFQDTNPSQFEIIRLLTDYENPVVMAVGDDDQAIFEFQGASASNLLDFQNHYGAKVVTLLDNYRSTGEILDFSHRVAEQVDDSFAKHHNVAKILRSMLDSWRKDQPNSELLAKKLPTLSRHEFMLASDEYYWVAEQIADLIKSGVAPEDIAIIAPRHKYIGALLPYLKAVGVNISYEKKSNLLEDPALHELIILAEFISDLAAEYPASHQLLEILSFPFFEIDPVVAVSAVQRARTVKKTALDYLLESSDPKLNTLARWFASLATESFSAPLELWLDYLIGRQDLAGFHSPYLDYYNEHSTPEAQFEFFNNLTALRNTIISHTKNPHPRLADLIEMLEDYEAAGASIVSTSIFQDGDHAIQVMSAHKSKGLEFQYVFLIALDELAWGKAKGNNNPFALPKNLTQIRHTGITDDEQLRLLFVAITRAKEYLVMTNSIQDFNDKKVARLGYLNEQRDDKAAVQLSPYLPEGKQEIFLHYDDFDTSVRIDATEKSWISAYQILTPNLKKILQSRLEHYRLTASDLTAFIDIIYAGPQSLYRSRILQAPDEPLTAGIAFGNLIHATFEQVTSQGLDNSAALDFFQTKAADLPLPPSEISQLTEKGLHDLQISLNHFSDILRSPAAKAEVNLSSEHLDFDGIPITGKIDHLAIDPATKTIEIYDFKTGKFHDSKWSSHPTLFKYALQLEFYKRLLNLSPTYRNFSITKGHILFVSPDDEDLVYDKVYDFDDVISAPDFKTLAKAIYQRIMTLDFIDNPELNLPADKSHTMRDLKAFIQVLLELEKK